MTQGPEHDMRSGQRPGGIRDGQRGYLDRDVSLHGRERWDALYDLQAAIFCLKYLYNTPG